MKSVSRSRGGGDVRDGNFALTLTLDPWVVAPIMAHPSFPLPITRAKAALVHATPETLANARGASQKKA